jgi:phosphotransferase system enzyme I (PtsP)
MSAAAIGPIKAMVLSLDVGEAAREVEALLAASGDAASLREPLRALAERLGARL